MPWIRKERPGGDSFGHEWPAAGAIVEVTPEQATALLAIRDGGFSEVIRPVEEPEDTPADPVVDVTEPAPAESISEAPAPRKRAATKKTAAPAAPVEE